MILMISIIAVANFLQVKTPEENLLDKLGVYFGTDKSSIGHFYTRSYEKVFAPLRNKRLNFLEIGIAGGASVKLWNAYFSHPETKLFFIDINDESLSLCRSLSQHFKRISCYKVDQENREALLQFIGQIGGNFDLIIDDGGHTMKQQITSFEVLFPHVKSAGIHIIEDLHTSYWEGDQEITTVNFLKTLIDHMNYISAKTCCADIAKFNNNFENYYQQHIKAITFCCSLCFIYKA